jgi:hypothetical protein
MSSFGEALANSDILPSCRWNPQQLTKNCVFVTIAYLKGMSADELAEYIQRRMPSGNPDNPAPTLAGVWNLLAAVARREGGRQPDFHGFSGNVYP